MTDSVSADYLLHILGGCIICPFTTDKHTYRLSLPPILLGQFSKLDSFDWAWRPLPPMWSGALRLPCVSMKLGLFVVVGHVPRRDGKEEEEEESGDCNGSPEDTQCRRRHGMDEHDGEGNHFRHGRAKGGHIDNTAKPAIIRLFRNFRDGSIPTPWNP